MALLASPPPSTGVDEVASEGRPPIDVIFPNLAEPPALIFASRLSLLNRACSAALLGLAGLAAPDVDADVGASSSLLFAAGVVALGGDEGSAILTF